MPYLETRDRTRLFFTEWGTTDGAPVVFIHGLALGMDMWEYQILDLAERGLHCISYDQRGNGHSDQPGHGYDFNTLAEDLATLLEHLNLEKVTLVGYSLGGGVVARYLSRYGTGRIARVALIASMTPYLQKSDENPEGMDPSMVYNGFVAGLRQDRPQLFAAVAPAWFGVGLPGVTVSPEIIQWALGLCNRASPYGINALFRAASTTDVRPDMAAFTMPTRIIHGDSDPFAPAEFTALRTARAIPNSHLTLYENASHGLFFTHKDRLNQDLYDFIQE